MRLAYAGIVGLGLGFSSAGLSTSYTQSSLIRTDDFGISDLTLMPSGRLRFHTQNLVDRGSIFDVSSDGVEVKEIQIRARQVEFTRPMPLPDGGSASFGPDSTVTFWGRDADSSETVALPREPQPYFTKGMHVSTAHPNELVVPVQKYRSDSEIYVQYLDFQGRVLHTSDVLFPYIGLHTTHLLANGRLLFVGHGGNYRTYIALVEVDGRVLWRRSLDRFCNVPGEFQDDILLFCSNQISVLTQDNVDRGLLPVPFVNWMHAVDRTGRYLYLAGQGVIYRFDVSLRIVQQMRLDALLSEPEAMAFGERGLGVLFKGRLDGEGRWIFATLSPDLVEQGRSTLEVGDTNGQKPFLTPLAVGFAASFYEFPSTGRVLIFGPSAEIEFTTVVESRWLRAPLAMPDGSVLIPADARAEILKFTPTAP